MVRMKVHTPPGLALVLCLILPISGVVGCQLVKGLLQDPALPADLATLGDVVLDCSPVEGSQSDQVAECLDSALNAAGAIAGHHDIGEAAESCAGVLRAGGTGAAELEMLDAKIDSVMAAHGSESGD